MANTKKKKSQVKTKKAVKSRTTGTKRLPAKPKKSKAPSSEKKTPVKKQPKISAPAAPQPQPRKFKVKEPFKKAILKRLILDKENLLAEVSEKIKNESNTLKFEIGDIYDIASNERERELTLMLGDRDREKLSDIEDALDRLQNGTYGICEECGEPIAEGRLKAMPFAKVCVECKSKDERERGVRKRYEEEPALAILEKTEVEEEEF
jgi:DnaK suppressor protein